MAALGGFLAVVVGTSLSNCSVDDRPVSVNAPGDGKPDGGVVCTGMTCVVVGTEQPGEPRCLPAGCPEDDACRDYEGALPSPGSDAGCITLADCPFTWKPAAREGDACRCTDSGCTLRQGEACSTSSACDGANCVATADGTSVCCASACTESEVCASDGSACIAAEPCSEGRRCSGSLHQSCVDGVWGTLTDCAALGCSTELDGCRRSAGQACEADADCGEGTCLATADGNKVCCTGACDTSCQRCLAELFTGAAAEPRYGQLMLRFLVYLAIAIGIAYLATTVPLGKRTLVGHIRAIWHTEEAQDLRNGVRDTAGPAVHKVERGIEAGYKAMKNDVAGSGSAGSGSAAPTP